MNESSLKKSGSTSQWRRTRARVIARDKVCQYCGSEDELTVDHIVPRRLNGSDHLENLQVLCKPCNLRKGGGFFDSHSTPPRLHVLFLPQSGTDASNKPSTASISHYEE